MGSVVAEETLGATKLQMMHLTASILFFVPLFFFRVECQSISLELWWTADDSITTYYYYDDTLLAALRNRDGTPQVNNNLHQSFTANITIQNGPAYLAIAGANRGPWVSFNPAGMILSNHLADNIQIQTDDTWKCKAYESEMTYKKWPAANKTQAEIKNAISTGDWQKWETAAQLLANGRPGPFHAQPLVHFVAINAFWIWDKSGYGQDPAEKVICIYQIPSWIGK